MVRELSDAQTTVEPKQEPIRSPTSNPLVVRPFRATVSVRRSGFIMSLPIWMGNSRCVGGDSQTCHGKANAKIELCPRTAGGMEFFVSPSGPEVTDCPSPVNTITYCFPFTA